jgi:hypothetical protein
MPMVESSRKGRTVRHLLIAPVIVTLVTGLSSMAQAQDEAQGASAGMQDSRLGENRPHLGSHLEGSWIFDIDVLGQGTTFHSLISFTAGGVVITSASLPGPANTPFYGSWREAGSNRFHAAFYAFLPDASGVGVALSKVSLNLQLTSRNTLTGTAVGANCDLQGENCVQTVEFQNTGKRILPE